MRQVKCYAFALACFAFSAWLLWPVDTGLPTVVDYRSSEIFTPQTVKTPQIHRVTGYCSCELCCGQWADGITYSGTPAREGRTIAADPSVWDIGTCVSIPGVGKRVVEDIGGAIKGKSIDVYFDSHEDALKFGVRWLVVGRC